MTTSRALAHPLINRFKRNAPYVCGPTADDIAIRNDIDRLDRRFRHRDREQAREQSENWSKQYEKVDVKIVNGEDEYFLHKDVICAQSGFFKRCFEIDMKERREDAVELHEEPVITYYVLRSLYADDYKYPGGDLRMSFDAEMYCFALKYDTPRLQDLAITHFRDNSSDVQDVRVEHSKIDDFLKAVELIYEGTFQDDDIMRAQAAMMARQRLFQLESFHYRQHDWNEWAERWAGQIARCEEFAVDVTYPSRRPNISIRFHNLSEWHFSFAFIDMVMEGAKVSKKQAIFALKATNGHVNKAVSMLQSNL